MKLGNPRKWNPAPLNLVICTVCISSGSRGKRGVFQPKAAKFVTLGQDNPTEVSWPQAAAAQPKLLEEAAWLLVTSAG